MGVNRRHEHLATGETVTLAGRLAGLAAPNTVVMRQDTALARTGRLCPGGCGITGAHWRGPSNGGVPRLQPDRGGECSPPGRTGRRHGVAGAALGAEPRGAWPGGAEPVAMGGFGGCVPEDTPFGIPSRLPTAAGPSSLWLADASDIVGQPRATRRHWKRI